MGDVVVFGIIFLLVLLCIYLYVESKDGKDD